MKKRLERELKQQEKFKLSWKGGMVERLGEVRKGEERGLRKGAERGI